MYVTSWELLVNTLELSKPLLPLLHLQLFVHVLKLYLLLVVLPDDDLLLHQGVPQQDAQEENLEPKLDDEQWVEQLEKTDVKVGKDDDAKPTSSALVKEAQQE